MKYKIPFNRPYLTGSESEYINDSLVSRHLCGDGNYTGKCQILMEERFGADKVLLTTSGTSALEMAAILCDVKPGDEVILPSYTFVSTVNAFLLRGAKPVFVDIRPDTLNIDESLIEEKITDNTSAIIPVHYAGISCEMDKICSIAKKHEILVVEDAAQGVNAKYNDSYLGTIGDFGAFSFHETKNFVCGEGGALVINKEEFLDRAEIIREKGTNRTLFCRGLVDKYTWVDIGSSYLISDLLAAVLLTQLEHMAEITRKRERIYNLYSQHLEPLSKQGHFKMPHIPLACTANYHMFYIILPDLETRQNLINHLKGLGILAVFHYVPLHTSPMGVKHGYSEGMLPVTENLSDRLLRLPFYVELSEGEIVTVVSEIRKFFEK